MNNMVDSIQYPSQQSLKIDQENRLIEEAKRIVYQRTRLQGDCFTSPHAVRDFLKLQLGTQQNEVFAVLFLSSQHQLIEYKELFFGTVDSCSVYPRVVMKEALKFNAAAVILAHNHPSQRLDPSCADRVLTTRIVDALSLVDIKVLDHMIASPNELFSFAEHGLI
ncbi:DNA repair protein RadC [uncultured Pseudoteredinibacter sp.]|uniref:RadC family protein n=1 Tax=uncultured Pseudoteredinibacter sp. TaxID=1641701 RepID=UPI00262EDA68|nr:DNA repair protein RadC [uncultured Pseudoteredinibacter sp.]